MGQKRRSPASEQQPSSETEEEEISKQVKPTQPSLKNPKSKSNPSQNSDPKHQLSHDNDGEGGSDSDTQAHMIVPRNAKLPSSKPVTDPSIPKTSTNTTMTEPKKSTISAANTSADAKADRPKRKKSTATEANTEEKRDRKKKKKKVVNLQEEETEKKDPKKLFQRIWSDEDEIVVFKGLIDYKEKGNDPFGNRKEFYNFIKKSLHLDFTQDQVDRKIIRLKQKYWNNANRAKPGEDPVISSPHELESYQLSKQIWGYEFEANRAMSESVKQGLKRSGKTPMEENNGNASFLNQFVQPRNYPMLPTPPPGFAEILAKNGSAYDERWKTVLIAEVQAYKARIDVLRDEASRVLDELVPTESDH